MKKLRVVFMGTPEFAVASLDAIAKSGHEVVGVVTTPDKPAGRGKQLKMSDVKKYALAHNIPILQPEKLKDDSFIEDLRDYMADVFVVVAFRMLPKQVYQMPPLGTFNVHASLLPQYRGAAPIQRAIMNGETLTGVTTFLLDEHTDTGEIIGQTSVEINPDDNAGTLHDKLMAAGAALAVETLNQLADNTANPHPQATDDTQLKTAPKIFKEDMHINWDNSANDVRNLVRGLSPYPGAFTFVTPSENSSESQPRVLKIYEVEISESKSTLKPGAFRVENAKKLIIATRTFDIFVKNLQMEGKKRMNIDEFLTGFRVDSYTEILK